MIPIKPTQSLTNTYHQTNSENEDELKLENRKATAKPNIARQIICKPIALPSDSETLDFLQHFVPQRRSFENSLEAKKEISCVSLRRTLSIKPNNNHKTAIGI